MTLNIQKHREQLELDAKKVQFMIEVLKLEENKELSPELLLEICQDCQRVQRTITNLQTDLILTLQWSLSNESSPLKAWTAPT